MTLTYVIYWPCEVAYSNMSAMDYLKVLEDGPLAAWLLLPKIVSPCVKLSQYYPQSFLL